MAGTGIPHAAGGRGRRTITSKAERVSRLALCGAVSIAALAFDSCAGGSDSGGGVPSAPAISFDEGDTIALVELALPQADSFVLRATIPVPKGVFPRADGNSPFQVFHRSAGTFAAQTEIVSRYPRAEDGADVVEVLARVTRPVNVQPGERQMFKVLYQPHAPDASSYDADVDALLATPGALVARTHDCFGNEYTADLLTDARDGAPGAASVRTLRSGPVAEQRATHEVLLPTEPQTGPTATLPHFFGVHAYVTRWREEPFFSLDLRVHNALSGLDATTSDDDALPEVWFREFELLLPQGWVVLNSFADPFEGAPYDDVGGARVWPVVKPMPDGTLHVMPRMGQFERRLVVCRAADEARARATLHEETLAFCRSGTSPDGMEYFSWWNDATARYFPQRQALPWLDSVGLEALRQQDTANFNARSAQVANGTGDQWPVISPNLGWAHPWGVSEAGMVSGAEIYLFDGIATAAAASRDGYRMSQLTHRMYTDRQHNVLFGLDGRPARFEQVVVQTPQGPILPVWWYNAPMLWNGDPFGFAYAPTFQSQAVAANGQGAAYSQALLGHESIDEAHWIRYTRSPKVLVWLGNDALAKDDLLAQAEGGLFAYTDIPQDHWGGIIPTGLLAAQNFTNAYPGNGVFFGRPEGWLLDLVSATYSTQDDEWRARVRPWFGKVIDMLERGQSSCTGLIMNTPLLNHFNGQYACRQSIEAAITENALVSMRESVFAGADTMRTSQVNRVLRKSVLGMISPLSWSETHHAPWAMIAVGPANITLPQFCDHIPADGNTNIPDLYQIWSSFAYAYRINGDARFLNKAKEALGSSNLHVIENTPLDNLENRAALLALSQRLP